MKEENITQFLGKKVSVGVPHYTEDRPFYYYGLVIDMDKDHLIIKMKKGFKQINYEDIIDIREE